MRGDTPHSFPLEEWEEIKSQGGLEHHPGPTALCFPGSGFRRKERQRGRGRDPRGEQAPTCAGSRLGPGLAPEAGGGAPQQAAGGEESGAVFRDVGRVGSDGVVGGRRRPSQGGHAAPRVRRLQLHAVWQRHLVLDAFLLILPARAGRARRGQGRVWGDVLRWGGREGEEMRAGVARRQGGGRGRGVDREGPRGAMMDGRLGEGAEVPGRGGVVAAQGFASVQPGQGSMQQRRAAHLAPCGRGATDRKASESSPQALRSTWGVSPPPQPPFRENPKHRAPGLQGPTLIQAFP